MATPVRVIAASKITRCSVCQKDISRGTNTAHRAGFGWVHHPVCMSGTPVAPATSVVNAVAGAADSPDKWGEFEDDDNGNDGIPFPAPTPAVKPVVQDAVRKGMGLPAKTSETTGNATVEAIEKKLFSELARAVADQERLVRGIAKAEMASAFTDSLPGLLAEITAQVKTATTELVKLKLEEARREFKSETARAIAKIAGSGLVRQVVEIKRPDGQVTEIAGEVFHSRFPWILELAQRGKPIFLPGPTGCGKTHLAMQVARALHGDQWESKFGILSCSPATAERHFLGRSIPKITTGEEIYRAADFVRIFENGGVFCLDEMDAADASVLLVINSALANKRLPLPDRTDNPVAKRHPDFVLIACANTWGRGADRRYVGRNQLDEATLDRFRIGTVPLNYNKGIERALCPDMDLFDTLAGWRSKIMEHGLERVLSTRFFGDAYDMVSGGSSVDNVRRAFFSGWRKEEVIKVLGHAMDTEDDD